MSFALNDRARRLLDRMVADATLLRVTPVDVAGATVVVVPAWLGLSSAALRAAATKAGANSDERTGFFMWLVIYMGVSGRETKADMASIRTVSGGRHSECTGGL